MSVGSKYSTVPKAGALTRITFGAGSGTWPLPAPKQELVKTFTASPDVNNSCGKNDQMVNISSGKNDQLVIISCGKNGQMVHISCGRIDPNSNISEAWILDLKHGFHFGA